MTIAVILYTVVVAALAPVIGRDTRTPELLEPR